MQVDEEEVRVVLWQTNTVNVHHALQVINGEFPQFEGLLQDFFSAQLRGLISFPI